MWTIFSPRRRRGYESPFFFIRAFASASPRPSQRPEVRAWERRLQVSRRAFRCTLAAVACSHLVCTRVQSTSNCTRPCLLIACLLMHTHARLSCFLESQRVLLLINACTHFMGLHEAVASVQRSSWQQHAQTTSLLAFGLCMRCTYVRVLFFSQPPREDCCSFGQLTAVFPAWPLP